jgi:hypothetical protein
MSGRQWKRWDVIGRVNAEKLTMAEASRICRISLRQLWRIRAAVAEAGKEALVHASRGRPPTNRTPEAVREQLIALRRKKYDGFNEAHFTEKLWGEAVTLRLSVRTVRRILREAGIAAVRRRRPRRHRRRRERKAQAGLMLLWDGSPHAWVEERGPGLCLVGAMDDATSDLLQDRPTTSGDTLALSTPHGKPLLAVEPIDPLVIHPSSFSPQQYVQASIPEARLSLCQFSKTSPQIGRILALRLVAQARSAHPDRSAGSSLAHREDFLQHTHELVPGRGRHHFFETTAFSAWLSSVRSATICFSLRFSSSSIFSRRASFTSRPPYSRFHRKYVCSLIAWRRQTSVTLTPLSSSFSTPMIFSSLNRLFCIRSSLVSPTTEDCRLTRSELWGAAHAGRAERLRSGKPPI